jgi:Holliday junction resolvase RusA-like endonuclease
LITLVLPIPPSANDLFDGGQKTKRRFKSQRYRDWEAEAGSSLWEQKPLGTVIGAYEVAIILPEMMRGDVDNRIKAVVDFLGPKGMGLTPDDKHMWKVSVERNPNVEPGWCHVTARSIKTARAA